MARFPEVGEAFGPYWIVGTLGRGATGVVFEAQDRRLGRSVALKVLSPLLTDDPVFRERFERQADQLRGLNSLHIVQVYEAGEQDGCLFLATQLVPGGDLAALIEAQGPLPPKVTVSVLGQLCEALAEAHERGLVHGDIKPTNVLVRDRGTVLYAYLCDFGVPGSPAYLAPELHDGVAADVRSDVYSLGCLLWSSLTGAPPYAGTDVQVALAHLRDPIPQLGTSGDSSLQINEILRRALAKDPGERYQSVTELGAALAGLTALPGPVSIAPPPPAAPEVAEVEPPADVELVETPAPVAPVAPEPPAPVAPPRRRAFGAGRTSAFAAPPEPVLDVEPVEAPAPDVELAEAPAPAREPDPEPTPAPRPLFVDDPVDEPAAAPTPEVPATPKLSRRERRAARKAAKRESADDDGADPAAYAEPEPEPEPDPQPEPLELPRAKTRRADKPAKKRDFGWLVPGALLGVVPIVAVVGAFVLLNGNTPAQTTPATEVTAGTAFSVGAFDVKAGWTVNPAPDVSTAGEPVTRIVVADLNVTNSSQDPQTASFSFSFIKDKKVITTVDCQSAVVGAGLEQSASCTTEVTLKNYTGWDTITVEESPGS